MYILHAYMFYYTYPLSDSEPLMTWCNTPAPSCDVTVVGLVTS